MIVTLMNQATRLRVKVRDTMSHKRGFTDLSVAAMKRSSFEVAVNSVVHNSNKFFVLKCQPPQLELCLANAEIDTKCVRDRLGVALVVSEEVVLRVQLEAGQERLHELRKAVSVHEHQPVRGKGFLVGGAVAVVVV